MPTNPQHISSRRGFLRASGAAAIGFGVLPQVVAAWLDDQTPEASPSQSATAPTRSRRPGAPAARSEQSRATPNSQPAFAPPLGVCTSIANAEVLRAAGCAYIEENAQGLLVPDRPEAEFAGRLKAARSCGLPVRAVNCFLPGSLKSTGPAADPAGVLEFAETAFRRARKVGIEHIVFGSSGSRTPPADFDLNEAERQFVELLKKMGPRAERHNVVVVVEPLQRGETTFINTVEHGARVVRAVDHPNIQLLADIFHMLRMDEPPESIRAAGGLLRHVHIAEKAERTPPGVAGDDFGSYLRALKDIGYRGRISIECGWKNLAEQLPKAVATLREQIAQAG